MSDRSSGAAQTVVPLAPKSNGKLEAGDPLDAAGQAILGMLHRAADAAEANYQQTLKMAEKLSGQFRAAENQIRELEAKVRHHQDRADLTRGGCIKSQQKLSRGFSVAEVGRRASRLLSKHFPEIREDRFLRTRHRQFD
jgi:hypothetical protein